LILLIVMNLPLHLMDMTLRAILNDGAVRTKHFDISEMTHCVE